MEELLKYFSFAYIRDYKGGKEIRSRTVPLDKNLENARKIIKELNLNVEIFDKDVRTRSFAVREINKQS